MPFLKDKNSRKDRQAKDARSPTSGMEVKSSIKGSTK